MNSPLFFFLRVCIHAMTQWQWLNKLLHKISFLIVAHAAVMLQSFLRHLFCVVYTCNLIVFSLKHTVQIFSDFKLSMKLFELNVNKQCEWCQPHPRIKIKLPTHRGLFHFFVLNKFERYTGWFKINLTLFHYDIFKIIGHSEIIFHISSTGVTLNSEVTVDKFQTTKVMSLTMIFTMR